MPTISIIVTTYNRKELLTKTLHSILHQTYCDFELIVVDNFSNYDFYEHIKSFEDDRIRPYQNQNNGIIAVNRNWGIKKAKGDYIAFCDDDDIWFKNKLEIQMEYLLRENIDLISSNVVLFRGKHYTKIFAQSKNRKVKSISDFLYRNQINTSTVLLRKSNKVYFNEDPNLVAIEDYSLWLGLYAGGYKFSFINVPLVYYRYQSGSHNSINCQYHLKLVYLMIDLKLKCPKVNVAPFIILNVVKYFFKYFKNSVQ